jgi:hypothetical protein
VVYREEYMAVVAPAAAAPPVVPAAIRSKWSTLQRLVHLVEQWGMVQGGRELDTLLWSGSNYEKSIII